MGEERRVTRMRGPKDEKVRGPRVGASSGRAATPARYRSSGSSFPRTHTVPEAGVVIQPGG